MQNADKKRDILISIRQITRAIDLHSKQIFSRYGLTGPQMIVLKTICENEPITSSKLAQAVSLSQATITSILDRLKAKGYVSREKSIEDKRKTNIISTSKAQSLMKQEPQLLQNDFIERFDALEGWEQHLLISSMQRIASMMNAKKLDGAAILSTSDIEEKS